MPPLGILPLECWNNADVERPKKHVGSIYLFCRLTLHDCSGSCEHTSYGTSLHSSLLVIVQSSGGRSLRFGKFPHLPWHKVAADFGNSLTLPPWHLRAFLYLYVCTSFPWYFLTLLPRHIFAILPGSGLGQDGVAVTLEPADMPLLAPSCTAASPLAHTLP